MSSGFTPGCGLKYWTHLHKNLRKRLDRAVFGFKIKLKKASCRGKIWIAEITNYTKMRGGFPLPEIYNDTNSDSSKDDAKVKIKFRPD